MKDPEMLETMVLRFTCLMFGLSLSLFVFEGTIKHHLEQYKEGESQTVLDLKKSVYDDDVIREGENVGRIL